MKNKEFVIKIASLNDKYEIANYLLQHSEFLEKFDPKQCRIFAVALGEKRPIPRFSSSVDISYPLHQKEHLGTLPVRSTSAAASASTSAACQQGVCVTSAWPQTVLIAGCNKRLFS